MGLLACIFCTVVPCLPLFTLGPLIDASYCVRVCLNLSVCFFYRFFLFYLVTCSTPILAVALVSPWHAFLLLHLILLTLLSLLLYPGLGCVSFLSALGRCRVEDGTLHEVKKKWSRARGPCIFRLLSPLPLCFGVLSFLGFRGRLGKLRGSVGIWDGNPRSNFPLYPASPLTCITIKPIISTCRVTVQIDFVQVLPRRT